jgi:hypothetical protein
MTRHDRKRTITIWQSTIVEVSQEDRKLWNVLKLTTSRGFIHVVLQ